MRLSRSDLELEVLYNRIRRKELDLQPDFQRGEVWDRIRQQRLIDTILRRWYVPAIHIVREPKSQNELVLDGQQRLQTIYAFFEDKLKIVGTFEPVSDEIASLDGLYYSQLPPEFQKRFQRFEITIITLTDFEPSEPSELFFRLNQQYALTPPEKRNALFGPARDQVKDVVSYLDEVKALTRGKVGFSNGRLAYDDIIARFCIVLQERTLQRQMNNAYVERFYRERRFDDEVVTEAKRVGKLFGEALEGIGKIRFNKATLFSWLVVVHSVQWPDAIVLQDFIKAFEKFRAQQSDEVGGPLVPFIRAYSDRASYRVADVNSVLLRDLVLHLAHAALVEPGPGETDLLSLLTVRMDAEDAETVLLNFIGKSGWGAIS